MSMLAMTLRVEEPVLFMRCASSMITVSQPMPCEFSQVRGDRWHEQGGALSTEEQGSACGAVPRHVHQ